VSEGTELLLYSGQGPSPFDLSIRDTSAATYPCRYGYAWVGEIVELGPGVTTPAPGTRVFALEPHGDFHVLSAADARVLEPGIPAERAVMAANLETAVTCLWDAGVSVGDEVVVMGGGVVGLLVTWLATRAGARVRLVEPRVSRQEIGLALGAATVVAPDDDEPDGAADVVIEATGQPSVLDHAIEHAGPEAAVVVASFYGARTFPIRLGTTFHRRRLQLRASQVSTIPPGRAPRWTRARRFGVVCRLLGAARLDKLLGTRVSLDDASRIYARLAEGCDGGAQTVFTYR
jgi:2-desacetyl-2-hydroxyethyl bacteriochlorophyllide A dehydrogenase